MAGTPATYFFLTIQCDRLVVQYDGTHGGKVTRPVRSAEDLREFLLSKAAEAGVEPDTLSVFSSSSLDFPEESTQDATVIALAREVRS